MATGIAYSEITSSWSLGPLLIKNYLRWKSDQVMSGLRNPLAVYHCPYNRSQTFYCSCQGLEWWDSLFIFPVSSLFLQPCPLALLAVTQFLKHIKLFSVSKPLQFSLLGMSTPSSFSWQTGTHLIITFSDGLTFWLLPKIVHSLILNPLLIFIIIQLAITLLRYLYLVYVCSCVSYPIRIWAF